MAKVEFKFDSETSDQGANRKRLAAGTPMIGQVCSIACNADMYEAFEAGLDDRAVIQTRLDGLGYDKGDAQAIEDAIDTLNNDTNITLIVTTGGNIAYEAARKRATNKPFISLLGAEPNSTSNRNFAGAVVMNSYESNRDRYQILRDLGVADNEIALFSNKNSRMHGQEVAHWKNIGTPPNNRVFEGGNKPNGDNDSAVYSANFASIPSAAGPLSNIRAVIISADPFFLQTKVDFVAAANNWITTGAAAGVKRYVVYPSCVYSEVTPVNANSIFYGPEKGNAYELLGQLAGIAVAVPSSVFLGYWPVNNKRLQV